MANNRSSSVMSMTITISNSLAQALDRKRQEAGLDSLDAVAEALLAGALYADATDAARLGYTDDELRAGIAEADASGAAVAWDAAAIRDEVRARFAARCPV
jgi:hypothetical protein